MDAAREPVHLSTWEKPQLFKKQIRRTWASTMTADFRLILPLQASLKPHPVQKADVFRHPTWASTRPASLRGEVVVRGDVENN